MKLKILLNLGNDLPDYKADQVVDEKDEAMATKLIRMGVAIEQPAIRVVADKEEKGSPTDDAKASQETGESKMNKPTSKNKEQ